MVDWHRRIEPKEPALSLDIVKRMQGRPLRGAGDVGREKLVEAARTVLRRRVPASLSRKAVADVAGVTPALVSYYFPDPDSLVAAATWPLIGKRIDELMGIVDDSTSWQDRLTRAVGFLVALNEAETTLIDRMIEAWRNKTLDPVLDDAYGRLRDFYLGGVEAGAWRSLDPDLFLHAIWGMCKAVAEARMIGMNNRVTMVVDLALNGLRPA